MEIIMELEELLMHGLTTREITDRLQRLRLARKARSMKEFLEDLARVCDDALERLEDDRR